MISYQFLLGRAQQGLLQQLLYMTIDSPIQEGNRLLHPLRSQRQAAVCEQRHISSSVIVMEQQGDHSLSSFLIHVTPTTQTNFKSSCYMGTYFHIMVGLYSLTNPTRNLSQGTNQKSNFILSM